MNEKQLSDRIGNIDDRLIQQAGQIPNYAQRHRKNGWRRIVSMAAVVALMVCSGAVGALAFSKETIVEIPVEQETIKIEEIGLTLILPDSWKGKYALEQNDDFMEYHVYNPAIREAVGGDSETLLSGGMLFYMKLWDEQLTKEQERVYRKVCETLEKYLLFLEKEHLSGDDAFEAVKEKFQEETKRREEAVDMAGEALDYAFDFMEDAFTGDSQEMVVFVTELNTNFYSIQYLKENDCDKYYRYNKGLLFDEQKENVLKELQAIEAEMVN